MDIYLKSYCWVTSAPVSRTYVSHIGSDDYGLSPHEGAFMGAHLHLFRRGNVFSWRRRIPGFFFHKTA